jgi:hypothetical protein
LKYEQDGINLFFIRYKLILCKKISPQQKENHGLKVPERLWSLAILLREERKRPSGEIPIRK